MDKYWVDSPHGSNGLGYDRGQAYQCLPLDDDDCGSGRKKTTRDPMSHRIIEKRRRDRMNNCLADLSRLLPSSYMKKGRGRIEKTEIIEMAIRHMRHLQAHGACQQLDKCEITAYLDQLYRSPDQYRKGYNDCMTETVRYISQTECVSAPEGTCTRLVTHLRQHCEKTLKEANGNDSSSSVVPETAATPPLNQGHTRPSSSSDNPQSSSTGGDSGDSRRGSGSEDSSGTCDKRCASPSEDYEAFCRPEAKRTLTDRRTLEENGALTRKSLEECQNYNHNDNVDYGPPRLFDGRQTPPTSPFSSSSEYGAYKFKNNIKQRFVADVGADNDLRPTSPRTSSQNSDSNDIKRPRLSKDDNRSACIPNVWQSKIEVDQQPAYRSVSKGSLKHYDHPMNNTNSFENSPAAEITAWQKQEPQYEQESLPIFVLHPKGTFYIPMSIELALVEPLLPDITQSSSLLHQINISVNFSMPSKCIPMRNPVIFREPMTKKPLSSQETLYPDPRLHPLHVEPTSHPRQWEEMDESDLYRYKQGVKSRCDNPAIIEEQTVSRKNLRTEPPSSADPSRWSFLMANARRT
ncbi:uncharacterized protein LOC136033296 [Artemia franciscana]|uniref:Uncharacterized protein n=1 Tax=Artemia franciscana TaxID=6661 RepID=A0AA88LF64_ARTSF|nr:hypothetical protein QYM36_001018 [Artemia franciscana]